MIPISDTDYQQSTQQHKHTGNNVVTVLHRRVRRAKRRTAFKQFWIRFWHHNADRIINATAITLLFTIIMAAFYAGSAYGASL